MAERIRTISEGENEPEIRHHDLLSTSLHSEYSLMNTSIISTASTDSQNKGLAKAHSVSKGKVVSFQISSTSSQIPCKLSFNF